MISDPTLASRISVWYCCCDLKDLYHCRYTHPLTPEEVDEYGALTYYKGHEVYEAFDLFAFHSRNLEISPRTSLWVETDTMFRRIKSFWVCPWTDRLMKLFSFNRIYMTFSDWMDMFNSYHSRTPLEYKVEVAFRIYDFDDDGYISIHDVIEYLRRCTDGELEEKDYDDVAALIVNHYDSDGDGMIGLTDFKLGMEKDRKFGDKFFQDIELNRDLRSFEEFFIM